jgi:hypothetical protein
LSSEIEEFVVQAFRDPMTEIRKQNIDGMIRNRRSFVPYGIGDGSGSYV